ncbi:MAG: gamma-glutamylcyclotransferase [Paracoccaceae bacterium]
MQAPQEWHQTDGRMWVFAYGSLIWNPGFAFDRQDVARLDGWHRSFCMTSIHYRGCEKNPGLVLALDAMSGASCHGVVFRVTPEREAETLAVLREREMVASAYQERWLAVEAANSGTVTALAFVIDRDHPQYRRALSLEEQAETIARAIGQRGSNRDYLFNTADHLSGLGIDDEEMIELTRLVRALPIASD